MVLILTQWIVNYFFEKKLSDNDINDIEIIINVKANPVNKNMVIHIVFLVV